MQLFPLKLIPDNTNIKWLNFRFIASGLSILLVVASWSLFAWRWQSEGMPVNLGIDFRGGNLIEFGFKTPPRIDEMRKDLNALGLGDVQIQEFGSKTEIAIRIQTQEGGDKAQQVAIHKIEDTLKKDYKDLTLRRSETVSGKISKELGSDAIISLALAMLGVAIYIWMRFEWQFGVGALLSLFHDVSLVIGYMALTWTQFDLTIVASLLTTVGYSLNDTIVVYDRIRENLRKYRKMAVTELLDLSVNETLSRTIITSGAMALSLVALLIFGGEVIRGFSATMLLGVIVGTYSSIYIAAPMLIWMNVNRDSFLPEAEQEKLARAKP
jgi:preprotein translocase subunit SecF